jgi:adenine-specific DNA-methyltransferase
VGHKVKSNGEVFTPDYIVKNMLDFVGYTDKIAQKHIIDNSCGDGAFLVEIVKRYCEQSDKKALKSELEKYIHGIEIDNSNYVDCLKSLDYVAAEYGVTGVRWDIKNADTLGVSAYDGKMDFVVGNPPYVRVHNLKDSHQKVKSFRFSQSGMTDLYITFYEIGFNMLNKTGKMCLITPSSFLTSVSGSELRSYVYDTRNLMKVIDIGHYQPFENITAYTFITMFDMSKKSDTIDYHVYDGENRQAQFIDTLSYAELYIDGKMFFGAKSDLRLLSEIGELSQDVAHNIVQVKNGFATLADKVFIGNIDSDDMIIIDTIKASTGKWTKSIFPYDAKSRPISEREIQQKHSEVYEYLISQKEQLLARSIQNKNEWYLFGRTQAINDVYKNKLAINTTIKDVNSIKLNVVPAGSGVYSGLYILYDGGYSEIKKALLNERFIGYVKSLKKYKSGGYYTFSSRDLRNYLTHYIITSNVSKKNKEVYEQSRIFTGNQRLVPSLS